MKRILPALFFVLLSACQQIRVLKPEPSLLPPPQELEISATIITTPTNDDILFEGENIGQSPATLKIQTIDQLFGSLAAASAPEGSVEQRIKVITDREVEVTLVLGDHTSKMANALNLTKILVFDYGEEITFDFNDSELKPAFRPMLAKQTEILNTFFKGVDIYICGHSDSIGKRKRNLELSLERALSVYNELLGADVPRAAMKVQGFGSDFPLVANDTEEGRARNRRIEIILGL